MKRSADVLRIFALPSMLFLSALALAQGGSFDRTLQTTDHPDLYVSTNAGSIRVFPGGNGHEVQIRAQVRANHGGDDMQSRVDQITKTPPIRQSGNSIHIGEGTDRRLYNSITIDYQITVPFNVAVNLHTGSGDIEIDQVGRFVAVDSGSGAVRAHGIHGPAELKTGSGDIEVEQQPLRGSGDAVTSCSASHSSVEQHEGRYFMQASTNCHAPYGNIHAQTGSGSIRLHGMAGHVERPAPVTSK